MRHRANPRFWECYRQLPEEIRVLADHSYQVLRQDPKHPSLHFKKMGRFWSVRVGLHYRALAVEGEDSIVWFWIGTHALYNRLLSAGWAFGSRTIRKTETQPIRWQPPAETMNRAGAPGTRLLVDVA